MLSKSDVSLMLFAISVGRLNVSTTDAATMERDCLLSKAVIALDSTTANDYLRLSFNKNYLNVGN